MHLFDTFSQKGLSLRNRIVMSPMCQYSATEDGVLTAWHFVHYGARAVGGVGAIIVEMSQVSPEGRLSPNDVGIWDDRQVPALRRLTEFVHGQGAKIGIQLGHAGRKADPVFDAVGASPVAFSDHYRVPIALDAQGISRIRDAFAAAARRADAAGFDFVELHGAHGYLLHQFLSPLSNQRTDGYGGDLTGRARLILDVAEDVRTALPPDKPVWARLSMHESGVAGGYGLDDTLRVARLLHERGVDLIDTSSGGNAVAAEQESPGYRLGIAAAVRAAGVPAMPVGRLADAALADAAVANGQADLVCIGRGLLRDPQWALRAQRELGLPVTAPEQYRRAYL